jgi:hypothetical protein
MSDFLRLLGHYWLVVKRRQLINLHMDDQKAFEVARDSGAEDDWTEEDDAEFEQIIKEVDALSDPERPEESEEAENRSEESEGEDQ